MPNHLRQQGAPRGLRRGWRVPSGAARAARHSADRAATASRSRRRRPVDRRPSARRVRRDAQHAAPAARPRRDGGAAHAPVAWQRARAQARARPRDRRLRPSTHRRRAFAHQSRRAGAGTLRGPVAFGEIRIPADGKRLRDVERETLELTMQLTENNQSAAARILCISRPTLARKLKAYGLGKDRNRITLGHA